MLKTKKDSGRAGMTEFEHLNAELIGFKAKGSSKNAKFKKPSDPRILELFY